MIPNPARQPRPPAFANNRSLPAMSSHPIPTATWPKSFRPAFPPRQHPSFMDNSPKHGFSQSGILPRPTSLENRPWEPFGIRHGLGSPEPYWKRVGGPIAKSAMMQRPPLPSYDIRKPIIYGPGLIPPKSAQPPNGPFIIKKQTTFIIKAPPQTKKPWLPTKPVVHMKPGEPLV
jgi:hypothetical protein